MKIIVDGYGGDNAPKEIVKGVVDAVNTQKDFHVVVTGNSSEIQKELARYTYEKSRVSVINTTEVITNDDIPTTAIKSKTDSSLVVAFNHLKNNDDIAALISAGSTGAVLTGSFMLLGRIKGIKRPALAPVMPTINGGKVLLIDCGANVDSKPDFLQQFAIMGSRYMTALYGIENPRVGLLSNGTEEKKGNIVNKEAFELLKNDKNINFVGNIEARDNLMGIVDVIVTDGFAGNIALKASEGLVQFVFGCLKNEIQKSFKAKIGALLLKSTFRKLKNSLDYNNIGGAPFLGVEKIVIKAHGSSKAVAICNSILNAKTMHDSEIIKKIKMSLSTNDGEE